MKALAVVSGGLDSVTLAYHLKNLVRVQELVLLTFNYGQRHLKELDYARKCANALDVRHLVLNISDVGRHLSRNALTGAADVPDGSYSGETLKVTIVPNRNAIMLTIAFGIAISQGLDLVGLAVHSGDHEIYPDCSLDFLDAFGEMQEKSYPDGPRLYTPFSRITKDKIIHWGVLAGVPFEDTWSCYRGGAMHCGTCSTCIERKMAFANADVDDPTSYQI